MWLRVLFWCVGAVLFAVALGITYWRVSRGPLKRAAELRAAERRADAIADEAHRRMAGLTPRPYPPLPNESSVPAISLLLVGAIAVGAGFLVSDAISPAPPTAPEPTVLELRVGMCLDRFPSLFSEWTAVEVACKSRVAKSRVVSPVGNGLDVRRCQFYGTNIRAWGVTLCALPVYRRGVCIPGYVLKGKLWLADSKVRDCNDVRAATQPRWNGVPAKAKLHALRVDKILSKGKGEFSCPNWSGWFVAYKGVGPRLCLVIA